MPGVPAAVAGGGRSSSNDPGAGWQEELLGLLQAPPTKSNIAALTEWHRRELSDARNNPLNSTLGSQYSAINSAGVRSYPSRSVGLAETANTLLYSDPSYGYEPIVAALRASANPNRIGQLVGASKWGTPAFTVSSGGGDGFLGGLAHDVASPFEGAYNAVTGIPGEIASGFTSAADTAGKWLMKAVLYAALLGLAVVLAIFGLMQLAGVNRQQLAETFRAATPEAA